MNNVNQEVEVLKSHSNFSNWFDKNIPPYVKNGRNFKPATNMILDIENMIEDKTVSGAPILNVLVYNFKNK
jgi:hypothetical protein